MQTGCEQAICHPWVLTQRGTCLRTVGVALTYLWVLSARAECLRYSLHEASLSCAGTGYATAYSLSPTGDLVGRFACGAAESQAFVAWGGEQVSQLALPGTYLSYAYDINDREQIVGAMEGSPMGHRAYLYQHGQVTDLGWLPGHNFSEALALNNTGVTVGYSSNVQTGPVLACQWIAGQIELLSLPAGPHSRATAVNEKNQVAGWMGWSPGFNYYAEAYVWTSGVVAPLGIPEGAFNSAANAISDAGVVCGVCSLPDPLGPGGYKSRAIAWIDGEIVDLGVIPGLLQSTARDLNDAGDIVGYCTNPPLMGNTQRAFIWRNGVMIALESFIDPTSPQYPIWHAYGINNNGQIAVTVKPPGVSERAARLDPVPPRPGDTNCDWLVNINDLLNVIGAWGPNAPPPPPFEGSPDLNGDGNVDINDLLLVIQDWG